MGLGTKGLVSLGLLGAGIGILFGEQIGAMIPVNADPKIKGALGGFIVGGPLGAVGNVAKQMFVGGGATSGVQGEW